LLLATLLSRRVERLTLGARAMERGDLSSRISPGYNDELGELTRAFNGMADHVRQPRAARDMLGLGSEGPLDGRPDPWTDFALPVAVPLAYTTE